MPALIPTDITGQIVWIGRVTEDTPDIRAEELQQADLRFAGIEGELHGGLTRPACVRTKAQYPQGTEIRNVRQMSIVSQEELDAIATAMGLHRIDPAWLGASMVVKDIPDFSHVPPSSRLQTPSGASLTIDMQNRPCIYPAKEIEKDHPGFGPKFKPAATHRRGVTAWVECEGPIAVGDALRLHVPDQRPWADPRTTDE